MPEPLTPGYTTPVYIAGPMRGRPEMGFPAFLDAAQRLRALGYQVRCPAEPDPDAGFDPHDLRPALASVLSWIVLHAGAVVVLPGWEQSKGCRAEIAAAQAVGTPVYELDAFLSRGGDAPRVGGQPQTPDRLAEIRERHANATEGPWWFDESDLTWRLHGVAGVMPPSADGLIPEQIVNKQILKAPKKGTTYAEYWPDDADAAFISHAWEDVCFLLAEVDRLSALSRLATDRYNELGQLRDAVHREGDTARADRLSFAMQEIRDLFIKAREGGEPRG